ncbi:MAG: hypothetical protein ACFB00_11290 [Parvularculaceae bacterium]
MAILCLASAPAAARPVSYVGGWTAIEETDRQSTSLWAHYTATPRLSVGWRSEWDRQANFQLHGVQATTLFKRWFGENFQANVYGFAGVGVADGVGDNPAGARVAGFAGVLADWETRRLFVSYRARITEAGAVGGNAAQALRLGFAPYEGDTDALHTWLMVEVDHRPENDVPVDVTPLVRFFKGAALLELGWSALDAQPLANFTYRF